LVIVDEWGLAIGDSHWEIELVIVDASGQLRPRLAHAGATHPASIQSLNS
jgi:hypothetical protein